MGRLILRWLFFVVLLHMVGWSWYTSVPENETKITLFLDLVAGLGAFGFGGPWSWAAIHGTTDARTGKPE